MFTILFYYTNSLLIFFYFFFFNDTATTEIYTLSLHDALPIWLAPPAGGRAPHLGAWPVPAAAALRPDRKSTRLNSSHEWISYAVFCLKKKRIKSTIFFFTLKKKRQ